MKPHPNSDSPIAKARQVARATLHASTAEQQALQAAKEAQRVKAEYKTARKTWKQARKIARKAAKSARRANRQLNALRAELKPTKRTRIAKGVRKNAQIKSKAKAVTRKRKAKSAGIVGVPDTTAPAASPETGSFPAARSPVGNASVNVPGEASSNPLVIP